MPCDATVRVFIQKAEKAIVITCVDRFNLLRL